jgi:hypothetical protein
MYRIHYSRQALIKVEFSRQILQKYSNTKFKENPSSESRVVPCGLADRMKLIVAFLTVANAPKNRGEVTTVLVTNTTSPLNVTINGQNEGNVHTTRVVRFLGKLHWAFRGLEPVTSNRGTQVEMPTSANCEARIKQHIQGNGVIRDTSPETHTEPAASVSACMINLLKLSGHFTYHQLQHSKILHGSHIAFMCFVWISEQTASSALYSTN